MTKKVEKAEIETSGLGTACVDVARRGFVRSDASLLLKGTQSCVGKNKAMKKLMFAAAVAACATVGLASDVGIVSENIVGYANTTFDVQAYYMSASQFLTAGTTTDSYSVQDIIPKVPATAVPLADKEAVIQVLNENGEAPDADYLYYLVDGTQVVSGFSTPGWYMTTGDEVYVKSTKSFKRGEGFIYSSPYVVDVDDNELPSSIQSAGEVNLEAKTITFDYQVYAALANTRPLEVSIQKFVPTFSPEAFEPIADKGAVIQLLNENGEALDEDYIYYLVDGSAATTGFDGPGWYTTSDEKNFVKSTKVFNPGEGFIYASPYAEGESGDEVSTYLTIQK